MTTFEQFFKENPDQKEIYEKEYSDFLLSENKHGDFKGRSPLGEGVAEDRLRAEDRGRLSPHLRIISHWIISYFLLLYTNNTEGQAKNCSAIFLTPSD